MHGSRQSSVGWVELLPMVKMGIKMRLFPGVKSLALIALVLFPHLSLAQQDYQLGDTREFWVWDLNVMPPGSRKITAKVKSVGPRSYIFVEESAWGNHITTPFIQFLSDRLEKQTAPGAILQNIGIIPLEEKIFAKLPSVIRADDRLIVLFADLGKYQNHEFDGFFNSFDQLTEEHAWKNYQQHSNEANIIYINGIRNSSYDYTVGVISHELQHLLAYHVGIKPEDSHQDSWLSESIAEGAMLITGNFTDQPHVNRFAESPGRFPLVSHTYVQYGPQLLFSAYLIDTLQNQKYFPLSYLTYSLKKGRQAVEDLFQSSANNNINFEAIYSNFISYIFDHSEQQIKVPSSISGKYGIIIPEIKAAARIEKFPAELHGTIAPYSFDAIDLTEELPSTAVVQLSIIPQSPSSPEKKQSEPNCANTSTMLWKPIHPKRIAVYAVGCEYRKSSDLVHYRMRVYDKPFLLPRSGLKIGL